MKYYILHACIHVNYTCTLPLAVLSTSGLFVGRADLTVEDSSSSPSLQGVLDSLENTERLSLRGANVIPELSEGVSAGGHSGSNVVSVKVNSEDAGEDACNHRAF